MRKLSFALVFSLATMIVGQAKASQIIASTTGLAAPVSRITFEEIILGQDTTLTTQYAGLGVSFSPNLYYSPQTGFGNVQGNDAGNYVLGSPAFVNPAVLMFSSTLTGAAFSMDGDNTPYTITALLNGTPVDSFTTTVGVSTSDFFGFQGINFNQISITQAGVGGGPYYLIDNIQLGAAATVTPEPSSIAFLGTGLVGLVGLMKKKIA